MITKITDFSRSYTCNYNTVCQSKISLEAKGLYLHLSSFPPDWDINKSWVCNFYNLGRSKVDRIFKELVNCGLLELLPINPELGRFSKHEYHLHCDISTPTEIPQKQYKGTKTQKPQKVSNYTVLNNDPYCDNTQIETDKLFQLTCDNLPVTDNLTQITCNKQPVTDNLSQIICDSLSVIDNSELQNKYIKENIQIGDSTLRVESPKKNKKNNKENNKQAAAANFDFENFCFSDFPESYSPLQLVGMIFDKEQSLKLSNSAITCLVSAYKQAFDSDTLFLYEHEGSAFLDWMVAKLQKSPNASSIKSFVAVAKSSLNKALSGKMDIYTKTDLLAFKLRFFYDGTFVSIDDFNRIEYIKPSGINAIADFSGYLDDLLESLVNMAL